MARALRGFGLKPGDVLAFGGKNHIDIHIPFYAALFNGLPIVGVDPFFKYGNYPITILIPFRSTFLFLDKKGYFALETLEFL